MPRRLATRTGLTGMPGGAAGRSARRATVPALVLAGLVVLAGCGTTRHPTVAELRQVPGATATYPGTTVYRTAAVEGTGGVDSGNPSILSTVGCANGVTARGVVLDWFDGTLRKAGWTKEPGAPATSPTGDFDTAYTWRKGHRSFTLSFATPRYARLTAAATHHPAGCPVVYRALAQ